MKIRPGQTAGADSLLIKGKRALLRALFELSDKMQRQSEHDEGETDPLGGLGQLCVERFGLALGEEGVRSAGYGAGEAGTLAGLHEDYGGDGDSGDELQDSEEELHLYRSFRRYSAIADGTIPQDGGYFKSYFAVYAVFLPPGQPHTAWLLTASR